MDSETWALIFAAISGIGAIWMVSGKTLSKSEKFGVWIIFGGFMLQTLYHGCLHKWTPIDVGLQIAFIGLALLIYLIVKLRKTV